MRTADMGGFSTIRRSPARWSPGATAASNLAAIEKHPA